MSAMAPRDPSLGLPDDEGRPFVIGLLGGVGSGKSFVAGLFAGLGGEVLDADRLAHEVLRRPDVKREVLLGFGESVLGEDGEVARPALGRLVFGDEASLARLNAIVHPRVWSAIGERLRVLATANAGGGGTGERAVAVLDVPLLAEASAASWCDLVVFVDASAPVRLARARSRGWNDSELARREAHQMPLAEKRALASASVSNDGDAKETEAQVARVWRDLVAPRLATKDRSALDHR